MNGLIARIQRFSTTNGPGLRSTVFLKGCPLRCRWCHNPEMQSFQKELLVYDKTCTRCGICMKVCRQGVHLVDGDRHALARENCVLCGNCAENCPKDAIELTGREMSTDEVMTVLMRDEIFYRNGKGGITLSGGEPLSQFDFTRELLEKCAAEGLHTCVDTSGFGGRAKELVPYAGLFLWDLKDTDSGRHLAMIGVPLEPILESLYETAEAGGAFYIRCPIIPGVNDSAEHLCEIGRIANRLKGVKQIDLVPYHDLGLMKAAAAGIPQESYTALQPEQKEKLLNTVRKETVLPVQWTS